MAKTKAVSQKLEKQVEQDIFHFLRIIGVYCWKNDSVGIFDPVKKVYRKSNNPFRIRGVSDILGIIQGRMLAIEVKSASGSVTDEQRQFLAKINNEGGIAFVARSVEQVAESLLKFFPNNPNLKKFCKEYVDNGSTMDH